MSSAASRSAVSGDQQDDASRLRLVALAQLALDGRARDPERHRHLADGIAPIVQQERPIPHPDEVLGALLLQPLAQPLRVLHRAGPHEVIEQDGRGLRQRRRPQRHDQAVGEDEVGEVHDDSDER
jgi:hypothetical protein